MQSSITLGRIGGITIGIHYTWLLAFGLITWSLATGLPSWNPRWGEGTYWLVGASAAILLFVSVLVHELCHSFVARARGLGVHSITLFMFGGVSNITGEARRPKDEFLIAVVGPVSSLVLGGLLVLALGDTNLRHYLPWTDLAPTRSGPLRFLAQYLATVNIALGIFNLVPGFPLDGGRVFRSILWAASGSLRWATDLSTMVGQLVGWGLIAYGAWRVFLYGDLFGGIWIGFIGWFLNNAAEATRAQSRTQGMFRGVRVRDLMTAAPLTLPPSAPVEELVYDFALRQAVRAVPVVQDGRLLGIVTLTDIREKPQEEWARLTVGDIMTASPLHLATPGQDVEAALQLMTEYDVNQLPVVEDGRLVGMLSRANILRYLQLARDLHLRSARAHVEGGT